MLFTVKTQSNDEQVTVVLLAKTDIDGKTYYFDHSALLASDELVSVLNNTGDPVNLDSSVGIEVPYITTSSPNAIGVTAVYNLFLPKVNEELPDAIFIAMQQKLASTGLTVEDLKELFKATKILRAYLNGEEKFAIRVPMNFFKNFERTSSLVEEINQSKDASLRVVNSSLNKTNFMETPDSKVFLRIPSYEEILTNDPEGLIPSITEVFRPYDKVEFMTPEYRAHLRKTDNIENIIGSADNNDIDVRDNELEYYEGLKELINYGIQQAYPDKPLEECISEGISSPDVKDYLIELAVIVASWNFGHTGYLPVGYDARELDSDADTYDDDDSSSNGSTSDTLESRKNFASINDNPENFIDGSEILKHIIESASSKNVYAPAEAIIKLLRWGKNKPTRLKLEGLDKYLDLNTYKTFQQSGSFSHLEVDKVDGASYQLLNVIEINENIKDPAYLQTLGVTNPNVNAPVGMILLKKYTNGETQFVHMSIIDFILDNIKNKQESKVAFINVSQSDVKVDPSVDKRATDSEKPMLETSVEYVKNDLNSKHVYYRSSELKDLLMKYNIPSSKVSYLSIINDQAPSRELNYIFTAQAFDTHSELLTKIKEYNMPAIRFVTATIGRLILPIVVRVSQRINMYQRQHYKSPSFEEVLNFYREDILKSGFTGDLDFSDDRLVEQKPLVGSARGNTASLSAFGDVPTVTGNPNRDSKPVEKEQPVKSAQPAQPAPKETTTQGSVNGFLPSNLFLAPIQGDIAYKVVDKGADVGFVIMRSQNNRKTYIFCRPEEAPLLSVQKQLFPMDRLIYVIVDMLRKVATNRPEVMNAKFANMESLDYYFDLFKNKK